MILYAIAAIILAMIFMWLSLKWPRRAFMLQIFLVGIWPSYIAILMPGLGFAVTPTRLGFFILTAAWFVHFALNGTMRWRVYQTIRASKPIFWLSIAYFGFGIVISAFVSPEPMKSIASGILKFVSMPLVMLFVISYVVNTKHIIQLMIMMLFTALCTEAIGIAEWFNGQNLFSLFIDPVSDIAKTMMEGKVRGDVYRIQSTFTNPLAFAEFLILMLPVGLYFVYRKDYGHWIRFGASLQSALGFLCIYLTGSRTSLALAILAILASLFLIYRNRIIFSKFVVWSGVLLVLLMILMPWDQVASAILSDENSVNSTLGRVYQLQVGIPAVLNSPVTGYGLQQGVTHVAPLIAIDNYYLTAALETGLTGLILLLCLQWYVLKKSFQVDISNSFPQMGRYIALAFISLFLNEITLSIIEAFTFYFVFVAVVLILHRETLNNIKRSILHVGSISRPSQLQLSRGYL